MLFSGASTTTLLHWQKTHLDQLSKNLMPLLVISSDYVHSICIDSSIHTYVRMLQYNVHCELIVVKLVIKHIMPT